MTRVRRLACAPLKPDAWRLPDQTGSQYPSPYQPSERPRLLWRPHPASNASGILVRSPCSGFSRRKPIFSSETEMSETIITEANRRPADMI